MIRSSVTVCLVPEAATGPFVFHGSLPAACSAAGELGFDAVEIFAPHGQLVDRGALRELLASHGLTLAAVGTGAGMLLHGHSLSDGDRFARERACDYVREIIDFGADFGAPAIIGSMQGRSGTSGGGTKPAALHSLAESLRDLAGHARERGADLLFEPLNRYETDLVTTLAEGSALIDRVGASNLKLLADLFHMNIEESDMAQAIADCGSRIGHVHFVDSNRRAAGFGHLDYPPVAAALRATGYGGYASAEAFPLPDSRAAAEMTIRSFRRHLAE